MTTFRSERRRDVDPSLVVRVNLNTGIATVDAGVLQPASGLLEDGVAATALRILGGWGLTRDLAGTLYFSEPGRGTVRRYVPVP